MNLLSGTVRKVVSLVVLMTMVAGVLSGCSGSGPRACPALEPWVGETRERIALADAMLDDLKTRNLWLDFDTVLGMFVYARVYYELADEQQSSVVPPSVAGLNSDLADAFAAYGGLVDELNLQSAASGLIITIFGGDLEELADLMMSLLYDGLELHLQLYGKLGDLFESALTDDICQEKPRVDPTKTPMPTPFPTVTVAPPINGLAIDWRFISQREGGQALNGYLPKDPDGGINESGVTIATGVDLGQLTANEIRVFNLDATLETKLIPYAGLRGEDARAALQIPLTITKADADAIDLAARTVFSNRVVSRYDKAIDTTGDAATFSELPSEAQTVIMSVAFHYGYALDTATPVFWKAVTEGRWEDAVAELRDFHDDYPSRRTIEADLLQTAIDRGAL